MDQSSQTAVILNDSTAGRRDSFGLLQRVLMNVIGLYVSCKFGGNVKLLMYDDSDHKATNDAIQDCNLTEYITQLPHHDYITLNHKSKALSEMLI